MALAVDGYAMFDGAERVQVKGLSPTPDGQVPIINAKGFPSWVPLDRLAEVPAATTVDLGGRTAIVEIKDGQPVARWSR
jgi:hypothetical protein